MYVLLPSLLLLTVAQAPVAVWETDVEAAYALEVNGDAILLDHGQGKRSLYDAKSGGKTAELENVFDARLSGGKLLLVRGTYHEPEAIEAWSLRPFVREWHKAIDERAALGEIVDRTLYYGTDTSVVKVSVPDFAVLDRREFPRYGWPLRPKVVDDTVYVNYAGHDTYGLKANDLSKGWRNYCDAWPQYVDEHGFVGTATVGWGLAIIDKGGKRRELERIADGGYTFSRTMPAVTKDYVVVGAKVSVYRRPPENPSDGSYRSGILVLSEYLIAFRRSNGSIAWRVPMKAAFPGSDRGTQPVVVKGDKVILFGANGQKEKRTWTMQMRDLTTGRLLWRSAPVAVTHEWLIATNGTRVFDLGSGKLRAWRLPD